MANIDLRESALTIFRAALDAADPGAAIHGVVQREGNTLRVQSRDYDLAKIRRIFVIGFGKAGAAMGQAIEEICGDRIARGAINVKYEHVAPLRKIELVQAGHPLPDENGLRGTQKILDILSETQKDDLVLCLISGGGSALLELPVEGVSLDEMRATTDALLRAGATINELNTLRKHLSQVKGGQLARRSNAPIISLVLSDVLGSPLDTIASGPTAPDSTSFADAIDILTQRGLLDKLPASVALHLARGAEGTAADTPKSGDPIFARVQNVVIADNSIACDAALQKARHLGFNALLLSTFMQGEAREVAQVFAAMAKEILHSDQPINKPACIIAGGETTVAVRGDGKGGRNQEFALAAALQISGLENILALAAGTDGTDGPTDAAGALADETTLTRAEKLGLDARAFLARNDSYHFFKPLGDLVSPGPTNTNVNDVMMMLVGRAG
jgi:glycerate 2-kinase